MSETVKIKVGNETWTVPKPDEKMHPDWDTWEISDWVDFLAVKGNGANEPRGIIITYKNK